LHAFSIAPTSEAGEFEEAPSRGSGPDMNIWKLSSNSDPEKVEYLVVDSVLAGGNGLWRIGGYQNQKESEGKHRSIEGGHRNNKPERTIGRIRLVLADGLVWSVANPTSSITTEVQG
jgi:hypothetical protein